MVLYSLDSGSDNPWELGLKNIVDFSQSPKRAQIITILNLCRDRKIDGIDKLSFGSAPLEKPHTLGQ